MDVNLKENIEQLVSMFEQGIEYEVNKTMAGFESIAPPQQLNTSFRSNFFDILENRMLETLRKFQITYLVPMKAKVQKNTDSEEILLSVTTVSGQINDVIDVTGIEVTPLEEPINENKTVEASSTSEAVGKDGMENEFESNKETIVAASMNEAPAGEIPREQTENMDNSVDEMTQTVDNSEINGNINATVAELMQDDGDQTQNDNIESEELESPPYIPLESNDIVHEEVNRNVMITPKQLRQQLPLVWPKGPENRLSMPEEQNLERLPIFSDDETLNECSNDQDCTDNQPILGFNDPSSEHMEGNILKRKENFEIEEENTMKRRKISIEHSNEQQAKSESEAIIDAVAEVGIAGSSQSLPVCDQTLTHIDHIQNDANYLTTIPKNIDTNVHCQHPLYRFECVLCYKTDKYIVNHYRDEHPELDVFISRPSPLMVHRMLRRSECVSLKNGQIRAFCFFCGKPLKMSHDDWQRHLLYHTGELDFYYTNRQLQMPDRIAAANCPIDNMHDIFENGAMKAFWCRWCNYIQFHKSRMIRHLEHEHALIDVNFNRNIEKIALLPELEPLSWTINRPYDVINEEQRYRCSIENCDTEFISLFGFRNHFQQYHSHHTTFECPHCQQSIQKLHRPLMLEIFCHFNLHGNYMNECTSCEQQFGKEFDILQHIVHSHFSENFMYRQSIVQTQCETEKREQTFLLQCNVCELRLGNAKKAADHFQRAHDSYYMDFAAIKMVKRTTNDGITSRFTPTERKTWIIRRSLFCQICDHMPKTKNELIDHFNHDHPGLEIAVKTGKMYINHAWDQGYKEFSVQNLHIDNHLVFYCVACRTEAQSTSLAYLTVPEVHAHWMLVHTKPPHAKPFRFYAIQFVACFHCKFISSFKEVKRHSHEAHPNEPIIITNMTNLKKCSMCNYTGDQLAHHLKTEHELIMRMDICDPTQFTDDTLKKLLAIDVHNKHKCDYCDETFETKDDVRDHINTVHGLPVKFHTFDDHNIRIFASCCEVIIDLQEFLNHWADPNHQIHGICKKCNFQTNDQLEFVDHQVKIHQIAKDADSLYRRYLQSRFWSTEVLFGNGLVMNKHNLLGTDYDDIKPFSKLIDNLLMHARRTNK